MSDEREQVDTANAAPIPPGRVSDLLEEIPRGTRRMSDELLEEIAGARMQVARHGSLGMPGPGQLLAVLVLAEERIIKADRAQKQLQHSLSRQAAEIRELRAALQQWESGVRVHAMHVAERSQLEAEIDRCRKELDDWWSGTRSRTPSGQIRLDKDGIVSTIELKAIEAFTGEGEFRHLKIRNGIITEAR